MIFNNIETLCKERKISISALEAACGLGNATIRGWKCSSPRVESLKRVADYFNVSIDELMREEETNAKG